jgi:hypothetical protein
MEMGFFGRVKMGKYKIKYKNFLFPKSQREREGHLIAPYLTGALSAFDFFTLRTCLERTSL